ncbi:hypothetical protein PTTG_27130 [Puccinia triticina 1-1 BBBD Race 1]|uniref:ATPase_2 domain-containing protein n=2 Tax=Puccinia triticina TaxID=208348 RepID=A0A180GMI9_PUCT1|nr:uncharacterized protein PtA15_2A721 [Puccinia triticina]OAV93885.1 hypothetical protein PTTG_27130 [Puccinia triticina 1-1 BBBD Race 1]WAQ82404.1 hypothetical protein PtA15_2A721 [Puccinia triticina]
MLYRPCSTLKYLYAPNSQRAFKHRPAWFPHRIPARTFYNQSVEVKELTSLLKLSPLFRVILGPPSSGKTALVREVASQKRLDDTPEFHSLTINLRSVDTSEHGSFMKAFVKHAHMADSFRDVVSSISKVEALGFSAKFRETKISTESAANIFEDFGNRLKPWKISHGSRPCVLIIDEANVFQEMSDEVKEAKMQVVFTSSDSFFKSWLKKHVNNAHFETLVVGDLPYMEAKDYFLHKVKNHPYLTKTNKDRLESVDFQIPFRITGGRMFFIKKYINHVHVFGYFENPMEFPPTQLAYTFMEDDLLGKAKTYTGETALEVCKLLVDSPGYVDYRKLSEELGNAVVEEMIQQNILHFRPASAFSRDLYPPPSRSSVVTAQSKPALCAMEVLVKESRKQ